MAQATQTIRYDDLDLERKIRSDLNLEKLAIWKLTNSNKKNLKRTFQDEVILKDGQKISRKLEIMSIGDLGLLTTEDQKTYYALIEQWQEHGRSDGYTAFSLRKIAKRLGKKWSSTTYKTLLNSLLRLRGILFIWTNSYYNSETEETEELIDTFTILPVLKIYKKKKNEAVHGERAYYKFHDLILSNIRNNYSKPVILPIHFGIKNETAQLLYGLLDRVLSKKNFTYQKRSAELFKELGLEGSKYKYRSGRKQTLDRAVKELIGLPMSNGSILHSVSIEETKDKKDFKLVARHKKMKEIVGGSNSSNDVNDSNKDNNLQNTQPKTPEASLIEKFIEQFTFGDNKPIKQGEKQYKQARTLVKKYGEEKASYIVSFAGREAEKTNFPVQVFGAVFLYEDKALEKYQDIEKQNRKDSKLKKEQEEFLLAKELFDKIPKNEQNALRKKYEKEFIQTNKLSDEDFKDNSDLRIEMDFFVAERIQKEIIATHNKTS